MLGNDGQLHIGGTAETTVFFTPRQGSGDDDEVENENDVREVPSTLRPFVAFLSDRIQIYEEKNGRLQRTHVRKLLFDSKLVSPFRREDILRGVLVSRTPTLPVQNGSADATLCCDILLWALRLTAHLVERGKGDEHLRQLENLPAPCKGGWYPLAEAAFGPGWPDTLGEVTDKFLLLVKSTGAREARQRLLVSPSDEQWAGNGAAHFNLLRRVGVFDGLRMIPIDPGTWGSHFQANKYDFQLPQKPPRDWSDSDWDDYRTLAREEARPTYNHGTYQAQVIYSLPGLNRYEEFNEATRLAMMDVVLGSAGHWDEQWETLTINRVEGNSDTILLRSPLAHMLSKLSWLGIPDGDSIDWCRPGDRWHVPALELGRGRKWQFAHLKPLPGELANRLDTDDRLAAVIYKLGTPLFDPETKSASTQLLDALADAVGRNDVPNWDVFLGQVRSAWRGFYPTFGSAFPKALLVQRGGSKLTAEIPSDESEIYLPDIAKSPLAALKHFDLAVIAIETDDAIADRFSNEFPQGVIRASSLQTVNLVDGKPWNGVALGRLSDDAKLDWLIPVLLTVVAFHGPQSQGTASKSFKRHLDTLRDARVSVVGRIEIGLLHDGRPVSSPLPVPALWLNNSKTLLLGNEAKSDMASWSEALSDLLDRDDLEVPIRLILSNVEPQPDNGAIIRALVQLRLSEERYRQVREYWRGDLGQIIELLVPLLMILRPDASIRKLVELDTNEAVIEFLDDLKDSRIPR